MATVLSILSVIWTVFRVIWAVISAILKVVGTITTFLYYYITAVSIVPTDELYSIGKGALIASGGATMAGITQWVVGPLGWWTSVVVAGWCIVIQYTRKVLPYVLAHMNPAPSTPPSAKTGDSPKLP
jgi:hypothetical protein